MFKTYQIEDMAYECEEVMRKLATFIQRDSQIQGGRDVSTKVVQFTYRHSDPYQRAFNAIACAHVATKQLLAEVRAEDGR
jgi:hypothetical protein